MLCSTEVGSMPRSSAAMRITTPIPPPIAAPFDMSLPAVSKHLKVLERAGLVTRGREAQWRPCALDAGPLKEVDDWIERYRDIWEERLDRLDGYLKELQEKEKRHGRNRS